MRFFAFCLAVSALAMTSVAVVSALQTAAEPTREEPQRAPSPDRVTLARLTNSRAIYPVRFSVN